MNNAFRLIISIGVSLSAGFVGSIFTMPAISSGWYAGLAKPALNPPAWVFGPTWTTLYVLMGIALFLVWRRHSNILQNIGMSRVWRVGMVMFFVQLFLNATWSIIFFGLENPGWALVNIVLLWLAILGTMIAFAKISRTAAWLLVPYILWVSFATYLNYAIWALN